MRTVGQIDVRNVQLVAEPDALGGRVQLAFEAIARRVLGDQCRLPRLRVDADDRIAHEVREPDAAFTIVLHAVDALGTSDLREELNPFYVPSRIETDLPDLLIAEVRNTQVAVAVEAQAVRADLDRPACLQSEDHV